jgi:hypothetical protein
MTVVPRERKWRAHGESNPTNARIESRVQQPHWVGAYGSFICLLATRVNLLY